MKKKQLTGYIGFYMTVLQNEDEEAMKKSLPADYKETVDYIITNKLNKRESDVLTMRFDLDEKGFRTYREIGDVLGVSASVVQNKYMTGVCKCMSRKCQLMLTIGLKKYIAQEEREEKASIKKYYVTDGRLSTDFINYLKTCTVGLLGMPLRETYKILRGHSEPKNRRTDNLLDVLLLSEKQLYSMSGVGKGTIETLRNYEEMFLRKFNINSVDEFWNMYADWCRKNNVKLPASIMPIDVDQITGYHEFYKRVLGYTYDYPSVWQEVIKSMPMDYRDTVDVVLSETGLPVTLVEICKRYMDLGDEKKMTADEIVEEFDLKGVDTISHKMSDLFALCRKSGRFELLKIGVSQYNYLTGAAADKKVQLAKNGIEDSSIYYTTELVRMLTKLPPWIFPRRNEKYRNLIDRTIRPKNLLDVMLITDDQVVNVRGIRNVLAAEFEEDRSNFLKLYFPGTASQFRNIHESKNRAMV